ncbi:hypothetical protein DEAC_c13720 [Desulfosporosinus acididurans]|uniref:Integral membrane protein n=1 Tax=Desulfosporosinus acididurans TaxID=476652 RepID=A0A0J1FTA6_9FIRM|nr:hypothetical protein [Desulfosporosinus acididurans]KLU66705.1 hypothetical protein DEAC_c13720 [Desulfosporosinus acididurans]
MNFPYGEWILLGITLVTFVEKQRSRWFFLKLLAIWLGGKVFELILGSSSVWHYHYARLAVILFVGGYAWKRARRRVWPLVSTSFVISIETLFLVNDPGVLPFSSWLFALALVSVAWLTAKTYWGTVLALVGSVLWDQGLERFVYEGILRHVDLPDPFIWNFGTLFLTVWAGLLLGLKWKADSREVRAIPASDSLISARDEGTFDLSKEQDLR